MYFYVNKSNSISKDFGLVCDQFYSDKCEIRINRNATTKIKFVEIGGNNELENVEFIKRNPLKKIFDK